MTTLPTPHSSHPIPSAFLFWKLQARLTRLSNRVLLARHRLHEISDKTP